MQLYALQAYLWSLTFWDEPGIKSPYATHFMTGTNSRPDAESILGTLNARQQEAVRITSGPLLVIAGPGSGKTRVLTSRIAYLIATGSAYPSQILALTFTNKAAREMKRRVVNLVPEGAARGLAMGTFHSVMMRMLRVELKNGWLPGYTHEFSIYDTDDSERVIRQLMDELHIDRKELAPRTIRAAISRQKNHMVSPGQYEEQAKTPRQRLIAQVYAGYKASLHASNALDFDDLLLKPLELFRKHPDTLKKYQQKWRHVHIDEYQDTNHVQYRLSHLVAREHRNICVVGDDAQSIYAFRGADMRNILNFHEHYPEANIVRLEQNYRSSGNIVRLADSVIKRNTNQLRKDLWTDNGDGDAVQLIQALTGRAEADKASDRIREHKSRHGYAYSDCAILYRTNAQSRSFEDALRTADIPYRVVGGTSFYQRKEIKDALAYLRLLVNPDDHTSLVRIINYPARGIGLKTQEKLADYARFNGISQWEALKQCKQLPLAGRAVRVLSGFYTLITKHRDLLSKAPPQEVAKALLMEANLFLELSKDSTDRESVRTNNVEELISAIAQHVQDSPESTLSSFLQSTALLTDADQGDDNEDRVTLMTLHASKGLEFKMVFIGGLEEGLFPSIRALQSKDLAKLEEERRLFYVGITRAERHLYLAWAQSRLRFGKVVDGIPSMFLGELEDSLLQKEGYRTSFGRGKTRPVGASRRARNYITPAGRRPPQQDKSEIRPGMRVSHNVFGEGRVVSTTGHGDEKVATIHFDERGHMKIMLRFASLHVLK